MPRRFKNWVYETGLFSSLLFLLGSDEGRTWVNAKLWWVIVTLIGVAYVRLAGPFVWVRVRQAWNSIRDHREDREVPPKRWKQTVVSLIVVIISVLVFIAMVAYTTYRFVTPPMSLATNVTFPKDDEIKPQVDLERDSGITRQTSEKQSEISRLENQLRDVATERDRAIKKLGNIVNARSRAEDFFVHAVANVGNPPGRDNSWKAFAIAISAVEQVMSDPVTTEDEFEYWQLVVEGEMQIIPSLSRIFRVAVGRSAVPPSRQLKQFNAFNDKHNKILNELDFQIETWQNSLEKIESEAEKGNP